MPADQLLPVRSSAAAAATMSATRVGRATMWKSSTAENPFDDHDARLQCQRRI